MPKNPSPELTPSPDGSGRRRVVIDDEPIAEAYDYTADLADHMSYDEFLNEAAEDKIDTGITLTRADGTTEVVIPGQTETLGVGDEKPFTTKPNGSERRPNGRSRSFDREAAVERAEAGLDGTVRAATFVEGRIPKTGKPRFESETVTPDGTEIVTVMNGEYNRKLLSRASKNGGDRFETNEPISYTRTKVLHVGRSKRNRPRIVYLVDATELSDKAAHPRKKR